MPVKFFEDVMSTIENAQEREALKKAIESNPKAAEKLKQLEALATDGEKFVKWDKESGAETRRRFTEYDKLTKELEDAKAIIAAHDKKNGTDQQVDLTDMNLDQIQEAMEARLRSRGFITKAEAETLARTEAAKAKADVYNHGFLQVENMEDAKRNHLTEYGKPLDREALVKFIADGKYGDINQAYKDFTADDRLSKIKSEAFAEGQKKGAEETTAKLAKENAELAMRGLPSDMDGSHGFVSRPGEPPKAADLKDIPGDYKLGKGHLAHAIAAKIASDRAAGKLMQ